MATASSPTAGRVSASWSGGRFSRALLRTATSVTASAATMRAAAAFRRRRPPRRGWHQRRRGESSPRDPLRPTPPLPSSKSVRTATTEGSIVRTTSGMRANTPPPVSDPSWGSGSSRARPNHGDESGDDENDCRKSGRSPHALSFHWSSCHSTKNPSPASSRCSADGLPKMSPSAACARLRGAGHSSAPTAGSSEVDMNETFPDRIPSSARYGNKPVTTARPTSRVSSAR